MSQLNTHCSTEITGSYVKRGEEKRNYSRSSKTTYAVTSRVRGRSGGVVAPCTFITLNGSEEYIKSAQWREEDHVDNYDN